MRICEWILLFFQTMESGALWITYRALGLLTIELYQPNLWRPHPRISINSLPVHCIFILKLMELHICMSNYVVILKYYTYTYTKFDYMFVWTEQWEHKPKLIPELNHRRMKILYSIVKYLAISQILLIIVNC